MSIGVTAIAFVVVVFSNDYREILKPLEKPLDRPSFASFRMLVWENSVVVMIGCNDGSS
jgi:hypothetical protein